MLTLWESGFLPVGWAMKLPLPNGRSWQKTHELVSLYFFVHNVPFDHIDTDEFHNMVQAINTLPSTKTL